MGGVNKVVEGWVALIFYMIDLMRQCRRRVRRKIYTIGAQGLTSTTTMAVMVTSRVMRENV